MVDGKPSSYAVWPWATQVELHAVCTQNGAVPQPLGTCHETIYTPDHHVFTAQAHIVGYPDPPPLSIDLDFQRACALNRSGPPPMAAAGTGTLDAGTPVGAAQPSPLRLDASAPPSASVSGPGSSPRTPAGGCSTTGHKTGGAAAWLVFLTSLGLAARALQKQSRRYQRRQRRDHSHGR